MRHFLDYSFRFLVYSFPIDLKNKILDIKCFLIHHERDASPDSSILSSIQSDNQNEDLNLPENSSLKFMMSEPQTRLAFQQLIFHKKSKYSNLMKFSAILFFSGNYSINSFEYHLNR
jgi:hypothetical protein